MNQGQGGYGKWPLSNNAPTIFNRLSDAGKTWRVYYDATQIVPMTALIHGSMLDQYWDKNFYTMDEFYQDVANGTLPAYAFVEPRSLYNNNDYHPPAPLAPNVPIGGWSDVRAGDLLAHDIYTAVKASATMTGVERTQYAAARHIRRAWQLLRPCGATDGHDTTKSPARR